MLTDSMGAEMVEFLGGFSGTQRGNPILKP